MVKTAWGSMKPLEIEEIIHRFCYPGEPEKLIVVSYGFGTVTIDLPDRIQIKTQDAFDYVKKHALEAYHPYEDSYNLPIDFFIKAIEYMDEDDVKIEQDYGDY